MTQNFDLTTVKTRKIGFGNVPTKLVNHNGILSVELDNGTVVSVDKLSRKDLYALIKMAAESTPTTNTPSHDVDSDVDDLIAFALKYGEENLGIAVYETLNEGNVETLNDLAQGVWEYNF